MSRSHTEMGACTEHREIIVTRSGCRSAIGVYATVFAPKLGAESGAGFPATAPVADQLQHCVRAPFTQSPALVMAPTRWRLVCSMLLGLQLDTAHLFEAALRITVLGFLSTVALARYLTRGEPIESRRLHGEHTCPVGRDHAGGDHDVGWSVTRAQNGRRTHIGVPVVVIFSATNRYTPHEDHDCLSCPYTGACLCLCHLGRVLVVRCRACACAGAGQWRSADRPRRLRCKAAPDSSRAVDATGHAASRSRCWRRPHSAYPRPCMRARCRRV